MVTKFHTIVSLTSPPGFGQVAPLPSFPQISTVDVLYVTIFLTYFTLTFAAQINFIVNQIRPASANYALPPTFTITFNRSGHSFPLSNPARVQSWTLAINYFCHGTHEIGEPHSKYFIFFLQNFRNKKSLKVIEEQIAAVHRSIMTVKGFSCALLKRRADSEFDDIEGQQVHFRPESIESLCNVTKFNRKELQSMYRGFKQVGFFTYLSIIV
ncbi:hypothetical protein GQR58_006357 [Nymphon striatum]|nr:hypothetical protein GQR58_006357 [Nymphon striatum]